MSSSRQTPSVLFMKMWREYDRDGNGFLDRKETSSLVRRILAKQQHKMEDGYGLESVGFKIGEEELQSFIDTSVAKFTLYCLYKLYHSFSKSEPHNLPNTAVGFV